MVSMGAENVDYHKVDKSENDGDLSPPLSPPKGFGARHIQALLLFITMTVAFSLRVHLSVSLVAMTTAPNVSYLCGTIRETHLRTDGVNRTNPYNKHLENCTKIHGNVLSKWDPYRSYKWSKTTQEMVLFSFFVGYTTMMAPMGLIALKYGGKRPIVFALIVNGVVTILTPWVPIFIGWIGVCVCRLLQGLTQAALYPCIHTMLGKWSPLSERGRLSTYIYSGSQFGTILTFQVSGALAGSPVLGWPTTFWLFGSLSLCCAGLLGWIGAESPHSCTRISSDELMYIVGDGSADVTSKKRKTPWKHILTSTAVWGLFATQAGSTMGYLLILTEIPTYMSKVLLIDIKRSGIYSSLPYIAMYVMLLFFGWLSDMLIVKKIMSVRNVRRAANSIGMVISGTFLIAFGFVNNTTLAVIFLILSLGLHSGIHVGFHINQIDLAPNYAGLVMAVGNMLANLMTLLVPVMVSNIIQDDVTNHHRWQIVFVIIAVIQFVTNLVFVIFVKAEVQEWNFYGDDDNDAEKFPLKDENVMQTPNGKEKENTRDMLRKEPR